MVTCPECKQKLNKEEGIVELPARYYHPACHAEWKLRREMWDYVRRLFGLRAPGPVNYTLYKQFQAQGITTREIYNALIYAYDIKRLDKVKAQERIGIVPYVLKDSNNYWNYKAQESSKIQQAVAGKIQTASTLQYTFQEPPKPNIEEIGFDSLKEDENG